MAASHHDEVTVPRGALLAVAALLAASLLAAGAGRWAGLGTPTPDPAESRRLLALDGRALHFLDRPDGGVEVLDAASGRRVQALHGELGFVRGALRALVRERQRRGLGPDQPFLLGLDEARRLTLADPATGVRLDLAAFGEAPAAAFARLLQAALLEARRATPETSPTRSPT